MKFAKDFAWGVATAAYQIEGGAFEADKGLNGWDVGSMTPGRIFEGHQGHVACDHYHKFKEDVALMKSLGIKDYRFSVNWARLIPEGAGKVSEDGKRFYRELLEELKGAGITPWMTLFHWDYPYALYLKGGWLNPESPLWFEEYAKTIATLFGDLCDHYILVNEPQCFIEIGHYQGTHAPFLRLSRKEELMAAHNVLLACSRAEKALRATIGRPVKVGFSQAVGPVMPVEKKDEDLAMRETFACHGDLFSANFWADPLVFGKYPEEFSAWFEEVGFAPDPAEVAGMKCRIDFYGVNTYTGIYIVDREGKAEYVMPRPSVPKTDMRWNVYDDSLYYVSKFLYARYRLPVVVTENGVALTEWKTLSGEVPDDMRIDFLKRYLGGLARAAAEVPVAGYFYWSLMDNFEWAEGFSKRFGLVFVDYDTLERTPKKSAYFYKKVIESNGEILDE